MDIRTLIAITLMVLIYFVFFSPEPKKAPPESSREIKKTESISLAAPSELDPEQAQSQELLQEKLVLRNDLISMEVNALGSILSAELHEYFESPDSEEKIKWNFSSTEGFNKQNLFISGKPISWKLIEKSEKGFVLDASQGAVQIRRRIELLPDSYILQITDEIKNGGERSLESHQSLELLQKYDIEEQASFLQRIFKPQTDFQQAVWFLDGDLETEMLNSLSKKDTHSGNISWFGYSTKYFFFGLVTQNLNQLNIEKLSDELVREEAQALAKQVPPGETRTHSLQFYVGPKEISKLEQAGAQLDRVIDYGNWIGPISRLLLSILRLFHNWIPNYGVGIILLTILVKLLLFPLAYKSAVSMKKLQLVQPKMKEIRERYKDNPQRMNAEMMALYRAERVNPLGGCLPLILQMPVFFALYRVFFASIEMRHEPFIGWIRDLSHYDPYFVTPALMTGLMYFQQKLTPVPSAGAEETEAIRIQKAMFKWMPFIFGAIMLFLPAGLTLYFLVNALLSILQQLYMNKKLAHLSPNSGTSSLKVANGGS